MSLPRVKHTPVAEQLWLLHETVTGFVKYIADRDVQSATRSLTRLLHIANGMILGIEIQLRAELKAADADLPEEMKAS
jgi:hypothetical protein